MTPLQLREHKKASKTLDEEPVFKPLKKGKLPRPFAKMGGSRLSSTGLLDVSDRHVLVFIMKDGDLLTDTHFYAHLFEKLPAGDLSPLFEFHWHPSHKGFHCKTPCKTEIDYTNRMLPGAPELGLKTKMLDPRKPHELAQLVALACANCGVSLRSKDASTQLDIWTSPST